MSRSDAGPPGPVAPAPKFRTAEPGDEERLLALKCAVFPGLVLANERRRWRWEFDANPARTDALPRAFVLEQGSELVGLFALVPYRVQVAEDVVVGTSGIDLCVDPRLRGGGHGREFARRWLAPDFCAFPFAVAMNDASRRLFTEQGGTLLSGEVDAIAFAYHLDDFHPPPPAAELLEVETIRDLPADTDVLWAAARRGQRLQLVRDAAYLRWRWRDFPFGGVTMLRARGADGATRGLAMVQDDPKGGHLYVAELLHGPDDTVAERSLVRHAVELARATPRRVLWAATRDARQKPALLAEGFVPFVGAIPTFLAKVHHRPASGPVTVAEWHVAIGDGDQLFNANEPAP